MQLRGALAILLFAAPTTLFGATRHVAVDGSDMSNCLAAPCRTIRYAIVVAEPGDVVQVGPGEFGSLDVTKAVELRGNQAGVDARGRNAASESVLNGVSLQADGIVLDGFTTTCTGSCVTNISARGTTKVRIVNNIIRGGGVQLDFDASGEERSEILFNDFIGEKLHGGPIGLPHSTLGLVIRPGLAGTNVLVDSNRFTGSTAALLTIADVVGIEEAVVITRNEFVIPEFAGYGLDLTGVDRVRIEHNAITGGSLASIRVRGASRYVLVMNNVIRDNTWGAIETRDEAAVRIEINTFLGNMRGLVLGSPAEVHLNRFSGDHLDVEVFGSAVVNAENNWFGCNDAPSGCASIRSDNPSSVVRASPWLVMLLSASPARIAPQRPSVVIADFTHNSEDEIVAGIPDGTIVEFSAVGGTVQPDRAETHGGIATTTFTSNVVGEGRVTAKIDGHEAVVNIVTAQPRRRSVGH